MWGLVIALLFVAAVTWVWKMRDPAGNVPGLPAWISPYLSLTDFQGVVCVSSRFWSLAALTGVFCMCVPGGTRGALERRLLMLLGPAALLSGWMTIYMFETRRMMIAVVPLMVLCIVALIQTAEVGGRWLLSRLFRREDLRFCSGAVLPILWISFALLLFGATALRGRAPLYTTWNRTGTFRFFEEFSERIQQEGDFLFAEYTQTAAAVEGFTGLPLLPIAWGYRSDREYRRAEDVMAKVVQENPDRRHLLVTPFESSALPGVALEPLFSGSLQTRILPRVHRRVVPQALRPNELNLHVYRLHPAGLVDNTRPYVRIMDGSALGISGRSRYMPARSIQDSGVRLSPYQSASVSVAVPPQGVNRLVLIFSLVDSAPDRHVAITSQGGSLSVSQSSLMEGWDILESSFPATASGWQELQLTTTSEMLLTDVFSFSADGLHRVPWSSSRGLESFRLAPVNAQWLRADAALALPSVGKMRQLLVYATNGRSDGVCSSLSIRERGVEAHTRSVTLDEGWSWNAVELDVGKSPPGSFAWYDLRVKPAWDPRLRGFPSDLGLLVHGLAALDFLD